MTDYSLPQISAFNRELKSLASAGIPIDLGRSTDAREVGDRLQEIEAAIAVRVGHSPSVEEAIDAAPELTQNYREALWMWLRCDDPTVALERITASAAAKRRMRSSVGRSLVYPLTLLCLAYLGLVLICLVTEPTIQDVAAQTADAAVVSPEGVPLLTLIRGWMPVWVPAVPVLVIVVLVVQHRRGRGIDSTPAVDTTRHADLASRLATLLGSGMPLHRAMTLGDPPSVDATETAERRTKSMPPLLKWAVRSDLSDAARARTLRFVARTYRRKADRQARLWQVVAPSVAGILLGGGIVLAYGLSLFVPVVRLLKQVATATGGFG